MSGFKVVSFVTCLSYAVGGCETVLTPSLVS